MARCDSIFPLLRCQGEWNKTCTQLPLFQILFQNPRNCSLGDVRRLCYHSWCDSMVIFEQISYHSWCDSMVIVEQISYHSWCDSMVIVEQISNTSDVYLSSSRFRRPSLLSSTSSFPSRNREYHLKTLDLFTAISHKPFAFPFVSVTDRPALKQNFMATLCSFPPSMTCKENWFYKTSYNSYTVEEKQSKPGVWADVGW